jgi:predicted ArsR family transcriptional regulator
VAAFMSESVGVLAEQPGSVPAQNVLLMLKRDGPLSLRDISGKMGISKMGAHKHLVALEERGLVERFYERSGVGRPKVWFKLSDKSSSLFPKAYADISLCALGFIERKLGREAVEQVLRERQNELYTRYSARLEGREGPERVRELARLRDQEGYMAEARRAGKLSMEILEHNCPILQIASKYQEACKTETQLFSRLLGSPVEATHRAAVGDSVCRFMIQPKPKGSLRI